MANPKTKQELLTAMADGYAKLNEQISKMTVVELETPFQFASDPKKCGARWIYDQCPRDLLIHLYEWQVLMRDFVNNIRKGQQRDYLPDEYRKNYHEMDRMLVEKHQQTSFSQAQQLLSQTHEEMIQRCREHKNTNLDIIVDEPYDITKDDIDYSSFDISITAGMEDMLCGSGYNAIKNLAEVFGKDIVITPKISKDRIKQAIASEENISIGTIVPNKTLTIK